MKCHFSYMRCVLSFVSLCFRLSANNNIWCAHSHSLALSLARCIRHFRMYMLNSCVFENIKFFDNGSYKHIQASWCHAHSVCACFSLCFFFLNCRVPFHHKILMSIFTELEATQHYTLCHMHAHYILLPTK